MKGRWVFTEYLHTALDPFGYVGLTRELMQAILKDWGCEIAFYFNYIID
jgi:hypothetical protein